MIGLRMRCSVGVRGVGLLFLFVCMHLSAQSNSESRTRTTFHISGTITQLGKPLTTSVSFEGASTRIAKADSAGHYEADLPLGVWKVAATLSPGSPMTRSSLSRPRLFRVTTPTNVTLDLFVRPPAFCNIGIITSDGRPPTQEAVDLRDEGCAGQEFFSAPSNDGVPFEVVVGGIGHDDLCRFMRPYDATCKREFGTFNLLTVQADNVVFTPFPSGGLLEATGSVVVNDGHRKYRRNSIKFLIGGGEAVEAQ